MNIDIPSMNIDKPLKLLFVCLSFLLLQTEARAQETVRSKIKDRVQKLKEKPANEKQETITLDGRTVTIWRPKLTKLHAPLVIFSHGFKGCETQSTFLTEALADAQFIVVAPRHKDALCDDGNVMQKAQESLLHPEDWSNQTYSDRKDDIVAVIEALKKDRKMADRIDFDNIGLMGHSLGGYTALGLAGAWKEWKMKGVRAVVALSPYCQPFAKQQTLNGITAPVQYQGGTRDVGITPFIKQENGCYDQTRATAMFVEYEGVGHFGWTDLLKKSRTSIIFYTVAFFERHLYGVQEQTLKSPREDVVELRTK